MRAPVSLLLLSVVPSILVSFPTNNFLTIPTPPSIWTDALVVLVASLVSLNVVNPSTSKELCKVVAPPTVRIPVILTWPTVSKFFDGLNIKPSLPSIFNLWNSFISVLSINVMWCDESSSVESTSILFVLVDIPDVSANPVVVEKVDIPAVKANPAVVEKVDIPEVAANPAITEVDIVPVPKPVIIKFWVFKCSETSRLRENIEFVVTIPTANTAVFALITGSVGTWVPIPRLPPSKNETPLVSSLIFCIPELFSPINWPLEVLPTLMLPPITSSFCAGISVPIPTLPPAWTTNLSGVPAEPTLNATSVIWSPALILTPSPLDS